MLDELGYVVHEVGSAEDALDILERERIDVLLTDVGLPQMSGTDLARMVRDRWPTVRIVFASGDESAKSASGILDALQLSKPFTLDSLQSVLSDG
ncbi:Autoinducer 1 sensor kinase/phosphatase LuxN [compost metagenome]